MAGDGHPAAGAVRNERAMPMAAVTASACNKVNVTPNHHAMAPAGPSRITFTPIRKLAWTAITGWSAIIPDAWTETSLMSAYAGQKDFRLGPAPGRLSSRTAIPPCIRKKSMRAALSGITWSATTSRFAISVRVSNWRAMRKRPGEKPTGARLLDQCSDARSAVPQYLAHLSGLQHEYSRISTAPTS